MPQAQVVGAEGKWGTHKKNGMPLATVKHDSARRDAMPCHSVAHKYLAYYLSSILCE